MKNYLAYPLALVYGLYFYALFQLSFLVRFGSLNTSFNILDFGSVLVGIISVVILLYFMRKLTRGRGFMLIPFLLMVPFSYLGALGGGLLGVLGIVAFGTIPFAVGLSVGYFAIKRFSHVKKTPVVSEPDRSSE